MKIKQETHFSELLMNLVKTCQPVTFVNGGLERYLMASCLSIRLLAKSTSSMSSSLLWDAKCIFCAFITQIGFFVIPDICFTASVIHSKLHLTTNIERSTLW